MRAVILASGLVNWQLSAGFVDSLALVQRSIGPGDDENAIAGWGESQEIDPALQAVMPIEWVHIPKCGSSFEATLLFSTGVCSNLPDPKDVLADMHYTLDLRCDRLHHGPSHTASLALYSRHEKLKGARLEQNMKLDSQDAHFVFCDVPADWKCNESAMDTSIARRAHAGLEFKPGFKNAKGRFMMFLRQPEQRLLSNYNFSMDISRTLPKTTSIEDYIDMDSGMVTKTLTRACDEHGCRGQPAPTKAEVEEAKTRLKTGFSFIGITERWNLSICLFNKMFKQTCRPFQFKNVNPSKGDSRSTYDDLLLKGFHDPYDTELFKIGTDIFEENLKKYNVDESTCEPCYRQAGLL